MKYSYKWLKDLVGFRQDVRGIADVFSRYAFDAEVSGNNLEIKLQPNRIGDASGHLGMAKELGFALKKSVHSPEISYKKSDFKTSEFVEIEVKDKRLCPRYTALYAELPKLGQTPVWMEQRLMDCGLRPINAVVDIMNYVMLEYGQPLHAFDFDKLAKTSSPRRSLQRSAGQKKAKIIVRLGQEGESITTLEDKTYKLTGKELLITDLLGPLAVAGIKGGKRAEVGSKTKAVVVEAANFDAVSIRKTSRELGIKTDASWRFENFLDPNLTSQAMQRVAYFLQDICSARIANDFVDAYPKKVSAKTIRVSLEDMEKIIGMPVKAKDAESIFKTFATKIIKQGGGVYVLKVSTLRQDLSLKEDVAEELARFIGYDKIPAATTEELVKAPEQSNEINLKRKIQDELVKLGFDETMNYSLIKNADIEISRHEGDKKDYIRVTGPVSKEYEFLRRSLATGLLKNISENAKNFDKVKIFEVGHVFSEENSLPKENIQLGLAVFGNTDAQVQFRELRGCLENLFKSLGVTEFVTKRGIAGGHDYLFYKFDENEEGHFAHITNFWKKILDDYDIKGPVSYAGISVDNLLSENRLAKTYQEINRLPVVKRDLSFFVDKNLEYSAIDDKINSSLMEGNPELFDIFEKDGKKSFSFHLYFRVADRTLTDKEVDGEMKKIIAGLEVIGAEIR